MQNALRRVTHIPHRLLYWVGIEIFRQKKDHHYVPDIYGHRAYKQIDIREDRMFKQLADEVISNHRSYLYYDRLYTIYQSLRNIRRVTSGTQEVNLAEIGVYKGGSSYFIASSARELGLLNVRLFSFDTFRGHSEVDIRPELDADHRANAGFSDADFDDVRKYLDDLEIVTVIQGRFQDTCSKLQDLRFHFVHLDVDIYEPTRFALGFFDDRLVIGGILVIDDYGFATCPGIQRATDEFLQSHKNYLCVHLLTGQCIVIKFREGKV